MKLWKNSYQEIKKVRSIALCALLIALNVGAKAFNIQVTQDLKIGFLEYLWEFLALSLVLF